MFCRLSVVLLDKGSELFDGCMVYSSIISPILYKLFEISVLFNNRLVEYDNGFEEADVAVEFANYDVNEFKKSMAMEFKFVSSFTDAVLLVELSTGSRFVLD